MNGCNNFCSYCIIPYVRGTIRSKDINSSLEEVKTLVKNGHSEIVLTGIHTGSYGTGLNYDLTDLIHEMSKINNLKRIRISSIEITELNDKFLNELQKNPKICNHLHIPLHYYLYFNLIFYLFLALFHFLFLHFLCFLVFC